MKSTRYAEKKTSVLRAAAYPFNALLSNHAPTNDPAWEDGVVTPERPAAFRMPTALMDIASSTPASARAEPSKTPESAATRVQTWAVRVVQGTMSVPVGYAA